LANGLACVAKYEAGAGSTAASESLFVADHKY